MSAQFPPFPQSPTSGFPPAASAASGFPAAPPVPPVQAAPVSYSLNTPAPAGYGAPVANPFASMNAMGLTANQGGSYLTYIDEQTPAEFLLQVNKFELRKGQKDTNRDKLIVIWTATVKASNHPGFPEGREVDGVHSIEARQQALLDFKAQLVAILRPLAAQFGLIMREHAIMRPDGTPFVTWDTAAMAVCTSLQNPFTGAQVPEAGMALRGYYVRCRAKFHLTKDGKPFTKLSWYPFDEAPGAAETDAD